MLVQPLFVPPQGRKARAALFLSGTGSNAEVILSNARNFSQSFEVAVLVTDAPLSSAAKRLGEEFSLPVAALDIRQFYADAGEASIRLDTPRRQQLRDAWSEALWRLIEPYHVDFGILAGFVPLTNLTGRIPCLNVHPGDLTVEKGGRRLYAGLHYLPVERAILNGERSLRSSVILARNYSDNGENEMDSGFVLGISEAMPVDLQNRDLKELQKIFDSRSGGAPDDELRQLAKLHIERLKFAGDHVVFPQVIDAFAAGRYGIDEKGLLCVNFPEHGGWSPVRTVEYCRNGTNNLIHPRLIRPRLSGVRRYFKWLYIKIVRAQGTPDYIARGWAVGMFVGCVVPVFCQLIVAIPLSFVFRGSKIGAALGTFITTPPTAVFIYPVLIWGGNKIIGGSLTYEEMRKLDWSNLDWDMFSNLGGQIIKAFFAGGLLWALIMTPLTYFLVRSLVVRYRRYRQSKMRTKDKKHA